MTRIDKTILKFLTNFRNLTLLGVSQIISSASLAIFWFVLAKLIETDQYGQISYFISIASIAGTFSLLGAGNTLLVLRGKQIQIHTTFYFMVILALVITSITLFFVIGNASVNFYTIGYVLFSLITVDLLGAKLYSNFAKILISQRILMISLGIGFYFIFGFEAIIFGLGLSFIPYIFFIYKVIVDKKIDFSLIKNHSKFLISNYFLDLARILFIHVDRLIIPIILSFSILGNYQLGVQIVSITYLLPATVFQYILPKESSGENISRLKKLTVVFSIIIVGIVVLVAPIGITILFPKFVETIGIVQIMSIQLIPATITYMFMSKFMAEEKSFFVVVGSIIGTAAKISTIFFFGTIFGITGVAIAFVLSSIAEAIFLVTISQIRKHNNKEKQNTS